MTLSPDVLQRIELPRTYVDGLNHTTTGELAIRSRVSRLIYSWRCAEASSVQAHMKQGLPLAPGMEIGSVKDAKNWEMGPARTVSEFDTNHYRGLLGNAWGG